MIPFPNKKYHIIYSDPPWWYAKRNKNTNFGLGVHRYPTMTTQEICDLPVQDIAEEQCLLYLWSTGPHMENALKVINAWGFVYITIAFTWVKTTKDGSDFFKGPGNYTSSNTELCLLARTPKCKLKPVNKLVPQIILAPRGEHSAKPPETRDRIVKSMGELSRIEMFARGTLPSNWDGWGDQYDNM